jgi:hypothetical protein
MTWIRVAITDVKVRFRSFDSMTAPPTIFSNLSVNHAQDKATRWRMWFTISCPEEHSAHLWISRNRFALSRTQNTHEVNCSSDEIRRRVFKSFIILHMDVLLLFCLPSDLWAKMWCIFSSRIWNIAWIFQCPNLSPDRFALNMTECSIMCDRMTCLCSCLFCRILQLRQRAIDNWSHRSWIESNGCDHLNLTIWKAFLSSTWSMAEQKLQTVAQDRLVSPTAKHLWMILLRPMGEFQLQLWDAPSRHSHDQVRAKKWRFWT